MTAALPAAVDAGTTDRQGMKCFDPDLRARPRGSSAAKEDSMSRWIACGALVAVACGGGAGGVGDGAGFRVVIDEADGAAPAEPVTFTDDEGTVFSVLEARASFRNVELYLPAGTSCSDVAGQLAGPVECHEEEIEDDDDGAKLEVQGPFVVDLLSGETTHDLSGVRVPALTYQRLDYRLEDADPADGVVAADDPIAGLSLWLRATYPDGTLTVRLRFNEDVRLEHPAGVAVGNSGGALVAALRLSSWFEGVPLAECIDEAGTDVTIGEDASGECGSLEPALKDNIKNSGQLQGE